MNEEVNRVVMTSRHQKEETLATWNKLAALYQDKFMDLEIYNESYDYLCNQLPNKTSSILEIGCGPGNITRYLMAQHPDLRIHGIDAAPNMVALAQQNNPHATFQVMDAREITELSHRFNAIVCGFCIPYLTPEETDQLFSDSFHLLEEQGLLYLSFVDGTEEQSGLKTGSTGDSLYFHYHPKDHLLDKLASNGFMLLREFTIPYMKADGSAEDHSVLVLRKYQLENHPSIT